MQVPDAGLLGLYSAPVSSYIHSALAHPENLPNPALASRLDV